MYDQNKEHAPQTTQGSDPTSPPEPLMLQTDEQLQQMVDPLLEVMDKNHDGFITWEEYLSHDQEQKTNQ